MSKQILFLCIYNLQRSVVAEYFFRQLLVRKRPDDSGKIEASSAGFLGETVNEWFEANNIPHPDPLYGRAPSDVAWKILFERGIDISRHRSRPVNKTIMDRSDIIIPFLEALKGDLVSIYPESESKVVLPRELLGRDSEFLWEDTALVPNDSRMYRFAHYNREYVSTQINEVIEFMGHVFPEILRRLLGEDGDKKPSGVISG